MNNDTKRELERIKERGFFNSWTTLGEGGWTEAYKFTKGWKTFELYHVHKKTVLAVTVTSNETKAREVFSSFGFSLYPDVHVIRLAKRQVYTG